MRSLSWAPKYRARESATTTRDGQAVALAQDVLDLADALRIQRFAVVGHDWGARAAYTLGALAPDRVSAIAELALAYQPRGEFEMPEFDSVMRGMGRMKDNGYPIEWGPGRHGPGDNVFAYFCGPDELPIEYTAEVLQIDDSYVPRGSDYWKFPQGRGDHWGITQPRSARYFRVQRLFHFTADGWRVS